MIENNLKEELVRKYRWAGKIRFVSFALLFIFLLLMRASGGYPYLSLPFVSLIFVGALLNQPYDFLIKRVNLYRFQFYQMMTDIIVISWLLYYMGGIEAPLVSIAYYAVILWAGVVSGTFAAFFAVAASSVSFSAVVILTHFGMLPDVSYFNYKMPTEQVFSLLLGNVSFLFAFGYFSARSSNIIKFLERKRQGESLKFKNKLLAIGYLVSGIAHDIINHLVSIRGYVKMLVNIEKSDTGRESDSVQSLARIEKLESESTELLNKLAHFSRKPKEKLIAIDLNKILEDALGLVLPLMRMSNVTVESGFEQDLTLVMVDRDQIQEVFVTLILNSLDAMPRKGKITIRTYRPKGDSYVKVILSDTGIGSPEAPLDIVEEPLFAIRSSGEVLGLGLAGAREIIARHKGKIDIQSTPGKGTTYVIQLPVAQKENR